MGRSIRKKQEFFGRRRARRDRGAAEAERDALGVQRGGGGAEVQRMTCDGAARVGTDRTRCAARRRESARRAHGVPPDGGSEKGRRMACEGPVRSRGSRARRDQRQNAWNRARQRLSQSSREMNRQDVKDAKTRNFPLSLAFLASLAVSFELASGARGSKPFDLPQERWTLRHPRDLARKPCPAPHLS